MLNFCAFMQLSGGFYSFSTVFFMGVDGYLCRSSMVIHDGESALVWSGCGRGLKFPV
jgi:hypothetical protein